MNDQIAKKPDAETEKTLRIMYDSFMDQYKDSAKAVAAIKYLSQQLQQPGFKLMRFDNVVFTIATVAEQTVEVHAMIGGRPTEAEKIKQLDTQLDKLIKALPKLGVRLMITSVPKKQVGAFEKIFKEYKFKEKQIEKNGQPVVAFYLGVGNGTAD